MDTRSDVCPHCEGLGYVEDGTMETDGYHAWTSGCRVCDGTGRVAPAEPCIVCGAPIMESLPPEEQGHDEGCPMVAVEEEVRQ